MQQEGNHTAVHGQLPPPVNGDAVAVHRLHDAGAHLVLVRDADKRPVWGHRWRTLPPVLEVAEAHVCTGRRLGVVPASIEAQVLDVDDPVEDLIDFWSGLGEPWLSLPTPRGIHGYYDAPAEPFNRRKWARGDLIHRGYVVLHDEGLVTLADALPDRRPAPLQYELLPDLLSSPAREQPQGAASPRRGPLVLPDLTRAPRGGRNVALFDWLRFQAYPHPRDGYTLRTWCEHWRETALAGRSMFPDRGGFPEREARDTAYSVATWTWCAPSRFDHSTERQRRRQLKRWHGDGGDGTLAAIRNRNAIIRAEVERAAQVSRAARGWKVRELADRFGLTRRTVRRVANGHT